MKKGFTLIELLAVIVILAIIALIATPIILGIINDAREESNERSVELYASAVRNGIAAYQLTGTNAPKSFEDLTIKYDGKVDCENVTISETGKVSLDKCTVNNGEKTYNYGMEEDETPDNGETPDSSSTQVYKPQYYYFGFDWTGTVGEAAAPTNPSSVPPTGEIRYLGYDVADGVVTAAYACFTRNNTEYCLKGSDTEAFATNTEIIKDAYSDVVDAPNACSFDGGSSYCSAGGLRADAASNGYVDASDGSASCLVYGDGSFGYIEY